MRLKSLPDDQTNFWTEIFQRELKDSEDPNDMMDMDPRKVSPGVLLFRGWGLESRLGPEAQARLKSLQDDLDALEEEDRSVLSVHSRREGFRQAGQHPTGPSRQSGDIWGPKFRVTS